MSTLNKLIKFVFSILIFIWMVSPVIIPDDYSGYTGKEREIAEVAVRATDPGERGLIERYRIEKVQNINSKWEVEIIIYSIFNFPVEKASCTLTSSDGRYEYWAECSFEEITPLSFWLILMSIFITILFKFGAILLIGLMVYYLKKKKI
mgnify:CR=1 FL=1